MRPVTRVTLEEVPCGAWGIAGESLHTADVLGMRASTNPAGVSTAISWSPLVASESPHLA